MKVSLSIPLLLLLITSPAFGQLSDATGLVNRLDIETGGYTFEVVSVSNFDVIDHEFDKDEKRLTLFVTSGLDNNLGELTIPQDLLSGNFTFYLNDVQYDPKIKSNDKISFVTLNFTGIGNNKIDIIGTETFAGTSEIPESDPVKTNDGGCLIATATFGSELAPQVQQLRELRDTKLLQTELGTNFMSLFNKIYYSFSPTVADYERENPAFKEMIKIGITPMIASLSILNYVDMDSETEVFGYGISLILLNIGMYFVAPVVLIMRFGKWAFR
ncbi:MAG: CFI-box-CTERM domain-containing protein [Nitrosopumilus sp.]